MFSAKGLGDSLLSKGLLLSAVLAKGFPDSLLLNKFSLCESVSELESSQFGDELLSPVEKFSSTTGF